MEFITSDFETFNDVFMGDKFAIEYESNEQLESVLLVHKKIFSYYSFISKKYKSLLRNETPDKMCKMPTVYEKDNKKYIILPFVILFDNDKYSVKLINTEKVFPLYGFNPHYHI